MKLNTPRWWYTRDRSHAPITRMALKPLSWVWAGVTARKIANTKGYAPGIPVISVGNLTVGGSGKTPITREILRLLREQGHAPSALSRGYGGKLEGPVVVDLDTHSAEDVGDEPLMLAQDGMVVISRDRVAGANDEWPFGDGSVFPSGPMREPIAAGFARADAVIVLLPTDLDKADPELIAVFGDLPVFTARLAAISAPPAGPQVGFAGIAKPWKVERSLIAAGCDLKDFVPLPDHAILTKDQFNFLKERAKVFDAGLVTTEKDWVRLSPEKRESIQAWPLNARFDDPAGFTKWLVADNVIAPT